VRAASSRSRIALISTYTHLSRDSIETMLRSSFPELQVDVFSITEILKRQRAWIAPNLHCVAKEFGRQIASGNISLRESYFRTTYAFTRLHAQMRRLIDPARHLFSFQMQSLYNTSVPGVPHFVYTDHAHLSNLHYQDFDRSTLRSPAWLALERTIYETATTVFTRSSDVATDLTRFYGISPDKVECVFAGSNVRVAETGAHNIDRYRKQRILFVGVDWERKGGPELLEAFTKILDEHPQAHLTVAGATVRSEARNCTFLGKVPPHELPRLYAESSIFCLPTRAEPFGIAFVEAMLHRLPIVGTRIGAIPDMVEEGVNGYLVNPGDPQGLRKALSRLLAAPETCQEFGQRSYEKAAQRYTWSAVGTRIRATILRRLEALSGLQQSAPAQSSRASAE